MKYCIFPLLLLLTGCFPYCYRARPLSLGCTDIAQNVQQAFESSSVCEGVYPNEKWWTFFQDPQLNFLIETSLASHPNIKMAETRILRARDEACETGSALLPHLYAAGEIGREKLSLFNSRTQTLTSLQYITEATTVLTSTIYELDIWKKNRNKYYASIDEMVAQVADYEEAKLLLSTTIASVYFDLQYNIKLLHIAQERLKARAELYGLLRQRFDRGVIAQFQLYETDTEVQKIRDLIYQLEGSIQIDRHALAALVGNPACTEFVVEPAAVFDTPLPLPSTLPIDLLARRPDITAQKWRVEASCLNIEVAKANFFPQIDLVAFIGYASFRLTKLFNRAALTWIGSAIGSLPIFTAGKLQAQLGIAREDFEIAIEKYNQLVLKAVEEVCDALSDLTTADNRIEALQRSVADSQSLYELTYQRFENKVADRISVLNAIEDVLKQEELEVAVQLERFHSAVSLIKAIGGGYYVCSCR